MSHLPPLRSDWVDRIFAKLTLAYGRAFLNQYEGIDMAMVRADWAHELSGFTDKPHCIKHGLENLPKDRPPNVLQFRALCRGAPEPAYKALPSPKGDPEKVRAKLAELRAILTTPRSTP